MPWRDVPFQVYKISNTVNNKLYIGVTSGKLKYRFSVHYHHAKRGSKLPLHLDMMKYGMDKFSIEPLDTIIESMVGRANIKEAEYIKLLNTKEPNGYNHNYILRKENKKLMTNGNI